MGGVRKLNTPELRGQRVRDRVRVTMFRFLREFRKGFRRKRPSTLQIGSEAFPLGQYTSPPLHPCHRLFDQDGYQDSFLTLPIVQTSLPVTFGYSLSSEAVVMRHLRRWIWLTKVIDTLNTRGLPCGLPEVIGMVQQVHCSRRGLLRRGHECTINKSAHTIKVWKLI